MASEHPVVIAGMVFVAALSVGIAVVLWRTLRKNPRLMGPKPKRPEIAAQWAWWIFLNACVAIGAAVGIWLAVRRHH